MTQGDGEISVSALPRKGSSLLIGIAGNAENMRANRC
jgi:hypothetical protein